MLRATLLSISLILCGISAQAQEFRALARVLAEGSSLQDDGRDVVMRLALTQGVPYRVFTQDDPRRLIVDFRTVNWDEITESFDASDRVTRFVTGRADQGWSRIVLHLDRAMGVEEAGMTTDPNSGTAEITLRLSPVSASTFAENARLPLGVSLPPVPIQSAPALRENGLPMIVLDPGHGGIDPGAQRAGVDEADLMLVFAIELREVLLRSGQFDAVLTREGDWFVSLPERVTIARSVGAAAFLSLHADALAEGRAHGATVYTLSDSASDEASEALAELHDRADLLAGVDLSGADDEVAGVLIDLARLETSPRSEALADHLVDGLAGAGAGLHRHPRLQAGFSVLKAADIPSALVELGFMSDESDLQNLRNPEWRAEVQAGIRDALLLWLAEDEVTSALLRQ